MHIRYTEVSSRTKPSKAFAVGLTAFGFVTLAPHAAQAQNTYSLNETQGLPSSGSPAVDISFDGAIDTLDVTQTGVYDFTIAGADGGSGNEGQPGGAGAFLTGQLTLSAGSQYLVAVGGAGGGDPAGGGGGGTFLYADNGSTDTLILVAGGGGGSGNADDDGSPGETTNQADAVPSDSGTGGVAGSSNGGAGGGGWGSSGSNGRNNVNTGGQGGPSAPDVGALAFDGGSGSPFEPPIYDFGGPGGFGGGGGGGYEGGGGGGGYDGGAGGSGSDGGAGGTSYWADSTTGGGAYAASLTAPTGFNPSADGNGFLTLTPNASPAPEPSQMALLAFITAGLGGLLWRARRRAKA